MKKLNFWLIFSKFDLFAKLKTSYIPHWKNEKTITLCRVNMKKKMKLSKWNPHSDSPICDLQIHNFVVYKKATLEKILQKSEKEKEKKK